MKFTIKDTIPFPRELVFSTQRDRLPELASYLNDIRSITVNERNDEGAVVRFVNEWQAGGTDIPAIARSFIKPEMLRWLDHAVWNSDDWSCNWRIELGFLPDAIEAKGLNHWKDRGNETLVVIDGEINVNARKIPGVPGLMAGTIGPAIEKFVVGLIEPNLKKTCQGVSRFLQEQRQG
jgi:hypothetical protein